MKSKLFKGIFFLFASLTFTTVKAQYGVFGIEANYGLNGVSQPSINNTSHFGAGVTYDIDEIYGLKLDFGSDKFRSKLLNPLKEEGINVTRFSFQGTLNVSTFIFRPTSEDFFSLLIHGGGGYTLVKSTVGNGSDNLVNFIGGVTPRFKIADNLFFTIDASIIVNVSQHYNFDGSLSYTDALNSFTGIMYNVTGGIAYKFDTY